MSKNVYLNKSSGRRRGLFGGLVAVGLVASAVMVLIWMFKGLWWLKTEYIEMRMSRARASGSAYSEPMVIQGVGAPNELTAMFEMVRNSPHVTGNKMYSAIAKNMQFVFDAQDPTINAYSRIVSAEGRTRPMVAVCAGNVRFANVAGLAMATAHNGYTNQLPALLHAMRNEWKGMLSVPDANEFVVSHGLAAIDDARVAEEAKGIAAGVLLTSIAHEVGHLSLGHLYAVDHDDINAEISRNQEREADLFASSVMSASPFGRYMFEGALLKHLAVSVFDGLEKDYRTRSHPYSRERLRNFIQQNLMKARALGITEGLVDQLAPVGSGGGKASQEKQ